MAVKLRGEGDRSFRLAPSVRADRAENLRPEEAAVMVGEVRRRVAPNATILRGAVVGVVVLVAALVLLWLVGRTLDRNRSSASDSQLVADVQVARATLQSDVAVASRKAAALAHMARVEQALARGDAHPDTLLVSARGPRAGSLAPLGVQRVLDVVSGGQTIGRIVTDAALDAS